MDRLFFGDKPIKTYLRFVVASIAFLFAGLVYVVAQEQTNKAYKTLNFGDEEKTIEAKLSELIGASLQIDGRPKTKTFHRSLFDNDGETRILWDGVSNNLGINNVHTVCGKNDTISVNCYILGDENEPIENGGLAIVEVSYIKFDTDKLIESFTQNFPNARKEGKTHKIENSRFPGVFLEYSRTYYSDLTPDKRVELSVPTASFTFTFTDLAKLSEKELSLWKSDLENKDGKARNSKECYDEVKENFLKILKQIELPDSERPNSAFFMNFGWENSRFDDLIIYGEPSVVFASTTILDFQRKKHRQSLEADKQEEKAKAKKQTDAATGF